MKHPHLPPLDPVPPVSEWEVGEGQPDAPRAVMVGGWRRFFTLAYWRMALLCLRAGHNPLNIVAVGELHVPDEMMKDLPEPGEF